ncbi:epididymal-specific lipocalin-8 [Dromiciops gliroides]|uniref:epididymal-specific lipocalin-8 n=1 Tax=Dromiciops gliroides TaxID=33562 RepID=UPI001CC82516|nr:epididymal-specific lipocalin-8 [Dromiciops gliroides]
MKTILLSILLGMLIILKAQAVFPKEKFDLVKFSGFWYEVGISSSSDMFLKQKGIKRLGAAIVTPMENNIRVKTIYDKSRECVKETILGKKVDIPGKFVFSGSREAYVIETDYKTYAIINVSILRKGMKLNILELFSRNLKNTDEGLKRLREISEKVGISRDNAFMLIYDDTCVKMLKKDNL